MATITYCDLCSSEMLGTPRSPAPHVCLLCRLSADEVLDCAEADRDHTPEAFRLVRPQRPTGSYGPARFG